MFLRRLSKINSQKFVFCLRCQFIHLKSQSLNDRELHKQKTAKERRCEDESAKLRMRSSNRSITLSPSHIRTFATSHSRIFPTKAKVRRQKWPHQNTIVPIFHCKRPKMHISVKQLLVSELDSSHYQKNSVAIVHYPAAYKFHLKYIKMIKVFSSYDKFPQEYIYFQRKFVSYQILEDLRKEDSNKQVLR